VRTDCCLLQNYILELEAKDASGATQSYHVTVFQPLPTQSNEQPMQLTKYEVKVRAADQSQAAWTAA
jgi:hypothetical protein